MTAACPFCSSAIYIRAGDKAMIEAPVWFFAYLTARRTKKPMFVWSGCAHAKRFDPQTPVEEAEKPVIEEAWNAHAETLLIERTKTWSAEARERFSKALGFYKACREIEFK
jgi:hypothetical protein